MNSRRISEVMDSSKETFKVFNCVLTCAGISIFAERNWGSNIRFCWQLFNTIVGILCVVTTGCFVLHNYDNIDVLIESSCICGSAGTMGISLIICIVNRYKFREFIEETIFKDTVLDIPVVKRSLKAKRGIMLKTLKDKVLGSQETLMKFTRILMKCYVFIFLIISTLFIVTPIFKMCVKMDVSLRREFNMWFPWSLDNFHVYMGSFMFFAYSGLLCGIAYPCLHTTIILLIGQIIRRLRILRFILTHINEIALEICKEDNDDWQRSCTDILTQCVAHYMNLKRFSNRLNGICWIFYLSLLLDAITLVCICSVKLAIADKLAPDTIKYYFHASGIILIVMAVCIHGQLVDTEFEKLEECVTEKWYLYDQKHLKNLRIFQMGLSERMPIHIFGSVTLSSTTFTWFVKAVMSFFTLAMSVLQK